MKYKKGDLVSGIVSGITKYGIFLNLENDYSGLIHISEISENFVRNVNDYINIKEKIWARIIEVDEKNKQLKLSIKNIDYKGDGKKIKVTDDNGFLPLKEKLDEWVALKKAEFK